MSEAQIQGWYRQFKDGQESTESDPHSGRSATSRTPKNVEHVQAAINENRRLTLQDLEEDLGISQTVVSEILMEDLGMNRVVAKFIPRLLPQEQKEFRTEVAQDLLETSNSDPDFLKQVITGDE
jgi:histone-lysine N-methyltransferase SETMAR